MKTWKIVAFSVAPAAIIWTTLICFVLVEMNSTYMIHEPSFLKQTISCFESKEGEVYFLYPLSYRNGLCKFDDKKEMTNYSIVEFYHEDIKIQGDDFAFNDNYVAYVGSVQRDNQFDRYLQIYNHNLELLDEIYLPNAHVHGMVLDGDCVFYTSSNNSNPDNVSLFKYRLLTKELFVSQNNLQENVLLDDNSTKLYVGLNHRLFLGRNDSKLLLPFYFDNNHYQHSYFFNLDVSTNSKGKLVIQNGDITVVKNQNNSCHLYENAFLVDNKIVFAVYEKNNNPNCGAKSQETCVCQYGKSHLYSYDLISNELITVDDFENGTFLIDYDLDGYCYYNNGNLFVNKIMKRECKRISPGEVKKSNLKKSLDFKNKYYISYHNEEFYGI